MHGSAAPKVNGQDGYRVKIYKVQLTTERVCGLCMACQMRVRVMQRGTTVTSRT